jgi:hypothetical protein
LTHTLLQRRVEPLEVASTRPRSPELAAYSGLPFPHGGPLFEQSDKGKGQAMVKSTRPLTTAFFKGSLGDAVSMMFGTVFPSQHLKKISDL